MVVIIQLNEAQLATLEEALNADGSKEVDELHLEIVEQMNTQRDFMSWDEGDDEPDLSEALWATFNYADLLTAPLEIGYGSGEELWSFLQEEHNFSGTDAQLLMDLLGKITPPQGDDDATT